MINRRFTWKHVVVYILGMFVLSFGVSLSIYANLGVSPVSSLAYALTLGTSISIGITTIIANSVYITSQMIVKKRIEVRDCVVQFFITFLFGFFMDFTLYLVHFLPEPTTIFTQFFYLFLSLFILPAGIFGCFISKLPLMPFESLAVVISEKFKMKFSRVKVYTDLTNVGIAASFCFITIQSFGAVGIGTVISAYFVGKILGLYIKYIQIYFDKWLNGNDNKDTSNLLMEEK